METNRILSDLLVVDFGQGMAPALATKILTELGARVVRFLPPGGDPFDRIYAANTAWRADQDTREWNGSTTDIESAVTAADLCIIGGEELIGEPFGPDSESLRRMNPRLIVGRMQDAPDALGRHGPAVDILAQARSGMMAEELVDRPVFSALPHPTYAAALQLLTMLFAALHDREQSGNGATVTSSLFEGALAFATPYWFSATRPDATFDFMPPKSPQQMIFRCADGRYVQIVLGVPGAKMRLYEAFGLDTSALDPNDRGVGGSGPRGFYGEYDKFAPLFALRASSDILAALTEVGLPNVDVLAPGECWSDPQAAEIGALKTLADGTRLPGLPFELDITNTAGASVARSARPTQPFEGLRVLDLGAWVAGPFASIPLADLGAEVIKVEPIEGDPHRFVHRSFAACNRGKKSVSLNLKSTAGMAAFRRLVGSADVVQHNFRPGVSARLGIDPAALHAINPALIVVESSAYGEVGPRAQRPGFDQLFQAFCGHEIRAAGPDAPPFWSRLNPIDVLTGLASAAGTAAAVFIRARYGRAAVIRSSLLRTGIFLLSELTQDAAGIYSSLPTIDRDQTGFSPIERIYRTSDGWIAIAARDAEMAHRLASVLDLEDMPTDPVSWADAEAQRIGSAIAKQQNKPLIQRLRDNRIMAEECAEGGLDLLSEPKLIAAGIVGVSNDPRYGTVHQIGALGRIAGQEVVDAFRCPLLGEHTGPILQSLGYDAEQLTAMRQENAIR